MTKKKGIWTNLERLLSTETVLAEWQNDLGADFVHARTFLNATGEQADEYPCTNRPPCGCAHEIIAHAHDRIVAACRCKPPECTTIQLQPKDIVIYALDARKFCRAIRCAFKFDDPPDERAIPCGTKHVWPVGIYGNVRSPVYFLIRPSEREFLEEIEGLITGQTNPFILLAPTQQHFTPTVQAVLQRHKAAFIPLSGTLALDAPGRFKVISSIQPILEDFTRRITESADTGKILQGIHREIAEVRKDHHDLKTAKARLEQMLAERLFSFTKNVDPRSFKIFCTILADGDVAKASRTLKMGDSTLRDVLRNWRGLGKAYQNMLDLVRWRKKIGRTEKLSLNDAILHEKANAADYPALIADILDGLLSMTAANWEEKCEELSDLLRPHVPR